MRGRARTRRVLKWVGTVACAFLFLSWITSEFVSISWYRERDGRHIGIRKGECFVYWRNGFLPPGSQPGWTVTNRRGHEWPPGWFPRIERGLTATLFGPKTRIIVPVWVPVVLIGTVTAFLWYVDRRRTHLGHCQHCGYDLTGNVSGRCPECGTAIEREGKPA
jgi:hypothetical protein